MDTDKKRMRVHSKHWDILLQYLEIHPELITGKFVCQNAKQKSKLLWNEVARQLNALGLGEKTAEKWKIALQDWKYKVKSKVAVIKGSQNKTGGGPPTTVTLSEQEERLMSIVGWTAVGNENIYESGLSRPTVVEQPQVVPLASQFLSGVVVGVTPPDHQYIAEEIVECEVSAEEPMESSAVNNQPSTSSMTQKSIKKKKSHRLRSENEVLEQYQHQTMAVLNNIADSVRNISNGVDSVAKELKGISQFLKIYLEGNIQGVNQTDNARSE